MKDKTSEIDREPRIHGHKDQVSQMIDTMLAMGPVNFGVNAPMIEPYAEKRLREDLTK